MIQCDATILIEKASYQFLTEGILFRYFVKVVEIAAGQN